MVVARTKKGKEQVPSVPDVQRGGRNRSPVYLMYKEGEGTGPQCT